MTANIFKFTRSSGLRNVAGVPPDDNPVPRETVQAVRWNGDMAIGWKVFDAMGVHVANVNLMPNKSYSMHLYVGRMGIRYFPTLQDAVAESYQGPPDEPIPWSFDPFISKSQLEPLRRKAYCKVVVDGFDVTNNLMPFLLSVTIMDKIDVMDEAVIEIDDRDARIPLPPIASSVSIELGWESEGTIEVFSGVVADLLSTGSRKEGGRRLHVECTGVNMLGDIKSPQQMNWGEGAPPGQKEGEHVNVSKVFSEAMGKAGFSGQLGGKFSGIGRDYWAMMNESPMHFGQRLASELGGHFKMKNGNHAIIVETGFGVDAPTHEVFAAWEINLIRWHIYPFVTRSQYASTASQHFDTTQSLWDFTKQASSGGSPWNMASAANQLPHSAPNANVGGQQNDGESAAGDDKRGSGWVIINGEPMARANGRCTISGVRPGVDGLYHIMEADHIYSREGYTTRLELQRPVFTGDVGGIYHEATPTPAPN